jgi:hypothetical protein
MRKTKKRKSNDQIDVDEYINGHLHNQDFNNDDPCNDLIFQQYKLFVELTDKVSDRRNIAHSFFITLNTFLFVIGSATLKNNDPNTINYYWLIIASVGGLLISITWICLIDRYGKLNSAKFKVINALENKLPTKPYFAEWKIVKSKEIKPKKYRTFTKTEVWIPWAFLLIYILTMAYSINAIFCLIDLPF